MKASSRHQAYRTLKTFFRWTVETGLLRENPMRGFSMRLPKGLPDMPAEDELRAAIAACPESLEGTRNRALILVLADAGLRASELLHLLIEDCRAADRGLFIRGQRPQGPRDVHRTDDHAGDQGLARASSESLA